MNLPASRRPLRALCPPWIWTLCLALALRALVPAGTMLDVEARDGMFPGLVLCPVQNPGLSMAGHHPMDGHPHPDDRPQSQACPLCLLAQHAGGPPLPTAVSMPVLAALAAVLPAAPAAVPPVSRVRGAPLGSRAPPPPFAFV
ncbi:DUF2946 family protein [Castellaniella defragrans]|uniref:DUF2946 family protein n=1 Tax=Castellaniella defragrans TaxID=75697 RepID=UPI0023F23CA7|nr:DUF2946 family protein [Castellaniella defragrans]